MLGNSAAKREPITLALVGDSSFLTQGAVRVIMLRAVVEEKMYFRRCYRDGVQVVEPPE